MYLEALSVELFYFTPFDRKWLQMAREAAEETLPNETLLINIFFQYKPINMEYTRAQVYTTIYLCMSACHTHRS